MYTETVIEAKDLNRLEKLVGCSCRAALLPTEGSTYLIVESMLPSRYCGELKVFSVELATIESKEHKNALLNSFGEYVKESIKHIIQNFKSSEELYERPSNNFGKF
jgi:hypothetical protein